MVVAVLEEVPVGAAMAEVDVLWSQVGVHFEHWSEFNANEQHILHKLDGVLVVEALPPSSDFPLQSSITL